MGFERERERSPTEGKKNNLRVGGGAEVRRGQRKKETHRRNKRGTPPSLWSWNNKIRRGSHSSVEFPIRTTNPKSGKLGRRGKGFTFGGDLQKSGVNYFPFGRGGGWEKTHGCTQKGSKKECGRKKTKGIDGRVDNSGKMVKVREKSENRKEKWRKKKV